MLILRKLQLLALFAMVGVCLTTVGCKSTGRGEGKPPPGEPREPTPGEAEEAPEEESHFYVGTDLKVYFYNAETGKTYRWNEETQEWEEVEDPPPPFKKYEHIPLPPGVEVAYATGAGPVQSRSLREQWGLVPDENGDYHPLLWFENCSSNNPFALSADDTVDFYIMTESTWVLATDVDPELKAAIGPENIFDWHIDLGDGQPPVGQVMLKDVTIRNLAAFMLGTNLPLITCDTPQGNWTLYVDEGANAAVIEWDGEVWRTIPLD